MDCKSEFVLIHKHEAWRPPHQNQAVALCLSCWFGSRLAIQEAFRIQIPGTKSHVLTFELCQSSSSALCVLEYSEISVKYIKHGNGNQSYRD